MTYTMRYLYTVAQYVQLHKIAQLRLGALTVFHVITKADWKLSSHVFVFWTLWSSLVFQMRVPRLKFLKVKMIKFC